MVTTVPSIYLSLETVIESIANYHKEDNSNMYDPMLSNVDNGEGDDDSKPGEILNESNTCLEPSLEEECPGESISPTKV